MFNYIKADLYRIFSKKGLYICIGLIFALMLGGLWLAAADLQLESITLVTAIVFGLYGTVMGGYLISTIFGDDFSAKTIPATVGFGNSRIALGITKFFLYVMLIVLFTAITFGFFLLLLVIFGLQLEWTHIQPMIKLVVINSILGSIASTVLAVIAGYATQKASTTMTIFIIVELDLFGTLMRLLFVRLDMVDLGKYMRLGLLQELGVKINVETVLPYVIYVTMFFVIGLLVLRQKDLEF